MLAGVGDFGVDFLVEAVDVGIDAVVQIDADGDGAHIKMLVGNHAQRFEDFSGLDGEIHAVLLY